MQETIGRVEFEQLAARAAVALAARAARRVLPVIRAEWIEPRAENLGAVSEAVRIAELFTIVTTPIGDFRDAWVDAAYAALSFAKGTERARAGVLIAHDTITAAHYLYVALHKPVPTSHESMDGREIARGCAHHATTLSATRMPETAPPIRADFDLLLTLSSQRSDAVAIPLEAFGPLWPDGLPDTWPPES